MKKISLNIILGIMLLSLCGCGSDNTLTYNDQNYEVTVEKELNCQSLNDIKIFVPKCFDDGSNQNDCFITNDNDVYILSTQKLFSNETNCKKINADNVKITKVLNGLNLFGDVENNFYYINSEKVLVKNDNFYSENYEITKDDNITYEGYQSTILKDGKMYAYNYEKREYELFKEFANEKIIDINYHGYIKTDKAYYIFKKTNAEQCEKYDDVECEYDYVKNDFLTNNYNDIAIFDVENSGKIDDSDSSIKVTVHDNKHLVDDYEKELAFIAKDGKYYYATLKK